MPRMPPLVAVLMICKRAARQIGQGLHNSAKRHGQQETHASEHHAADQKDAIAIKQEEAAVTCRHGAQY